MKNFIFLRLSNYTIEQTQCPINTPEEIKDTLAAMDDLGIRHEEIWVDTGLGLEPTGKHLSLVK